MKDGSIRFLAELQLSSRVLQLQLIRSRLLVTCVNSILEMQIKRQVISHRYWKEVRTLFKSDEAIEMMQVQYPRLIISTEKYYHSLDAKVGVVTRVGTNPKKERFGCTIY
jgi:hypothetical protein